MRFNSYNIFYIPQPKKVPKEFIRKSTVKKLPPEKDWYFIVTYENAKKQQITYNYEPHREIHCEGGWWQKNIAPFKPAGSSKGCSFYLDEYKNKKPVQLHWFLWNKADRTYHMYDQESVLADQEALYIAESITPELIIAKDLTNKSEKEITK